MVISGALGTYERRRNRLLHHKVRDFDTPAAATLLGKSVFPELHPAFLGVHEGAMGLEHVCDYVEMSDCPILLGALITDLNLGIYTARLERRCAIYTAKDRVTDAFQMSGMKIATAARLGMNPIVVSSTTTATAPSAPCWMARSTICSAGVMPTSRTSSAASRYQGRPSARWRMRWPKPRQYG